VFGGLSVYFLFIKNRKPPSHKKHVNIFIYKIKEGRLGKLFFLQGVSEMLGQTSEAISLAQTRKKVFINICQETPSSGCSLATW